MKMYEFARTETHMNRVSLGSREAERVDGGHGEQSLLVKTLLD